MQSKQEDPNKDLERKARKDRIPIECDPFLFIPEKIRYNAYKHQKYDRKR